MNSDIAASPANASASRVSANAALQSALEILETERVRLAREAKTNSMVGGVVALVIGGILAMMVTNAAGQLVVWVAIAPLLAAVGIAAWAYNSKVQEYCRTYKMLIVDEVVKIVAGGLQYSAQSHISQGEFEHSQLFRSPDRLNGEDLVVGSVGATQLRFSEIHAEYQTRNSKGQTQWHTIFRGLFFVADFNKNFVGTTLVQPDTAERLLGRFGQSMQELGNKLSFNGRELVKLEDPEFEKVFSVSSTDQIEARYILSPSLMRRLLDLRAEHGNELHAAFIANHIYLAVPTKRNLFEPPSLKTPVTVDAVRRCMADLQSVLSIVEELDLNTRIWSKA